MVRWTEYIERNPNIMLGKPVFKGTRITVQYVLERLAQGATAEDRLANYEGLLPEHITAALAFAAAVVASATEADENDWPPGYFAKVVGSMPDLERATQGEFETRLPLVTTRVSSGESRR